MLSKILTSSWGPHITRSIFPLFHCLFLFIFPANLVDNRFPPFFILPPPAQPNLLPHKSYSLCYPTEASPSKHLPDTAVFHDLSLVHTKIPNTLYRSFIFQGNDSQMPSPASSGHHPVRSEALSNPHHGFSTLADHSVPHPSKSTGIPRPQICRPLGHFHVFCSGLTQHYSFPNSTFPLLSATPISSPLPLLNYGSVSHLCPVSLTVSQMSCS